MNASRELEEAPEKKKDELELLKSIRKTTVNEKGEVLVDFGGRKGMRSEKYKARTAELLEKESELLARKPTKPKDILEWEKERKELNRELLQHESDPD
jgi:hypothetical protein